MYCDAYATHVRAGSFIVVLLLRTIFSLAFQIISGDIINVEPSDFHDKFRQAIFTQCRSENVIVFSEKSEHEKCIAKGAKLVGAFSIPQLI